MSEELTPIQQARKFVVFMHQLRSSCGVCRSVTDKTTTIDLGIPGCSTRCCPSSDCVDRVHQVIASLSESERAEIEKLNAYFVQHPVDSILREGERILLGLCSNPILLEMTWNFEEKKGNPNPRTAEAIGPGFKSFLDRNAEWIQKIRYCWGLDSSPDWFEKQQAQPWTSTTS